MRRSAIAVAIAVATLTACAGNSFDDNFCLVAEPILISLEDEITPETAEQILEHNLIYERLCGT